MLAHIDSATPLDNGNQWIHHHFTFYLPREVEQEILRRKQDLPAFKTPCFFGKEPQAEIDAATAREIAKDLGDPILAAMAAAATAVKGRIVLSEARFSGL